MDPHRFLSDVYRNERFATVVVGIGLISAGIAMRLAFLPAHTSDIDDYLLPWLASATARGGGYLRHPFTNYTAFYEHCLALMTLLPGPALVRIKAFSIAFDVLLASTVASMVPRRRSVLAFALTLAMPTIALNSAFLGQSDAIYASFVMLALLACDRRRPISAIIAFSVAIAIKLQALLFAPVLLLMFLEQRQPFRSFLLVPLAYVAFAMPMAFAGRPWTEILGVYGAQFRGIQVLSANAPNAWAILQKFIDYRPGLDFGLPFAVAATGAAIAALWRRRVVANSHGLWSAAAILLVLVPFVTPKMHDRYFYLVDPVLIVLFCHNRRYLAPLLLAQCASLLAYMPFILDGFTSASGWGRDGATIDPLWFSYRASPVLGAVAMAAALYRIVKIALSENTAKRKWPDIASRSAAPLDCPLPAPHTCSTVLPQVSPASSARCASATSSRANRRPISGAIAPFASIAKTRSARRCLSSPETA